MIGCILIGLTALEQTELYKFAIENMCVNNLFSFLLLKYFLNNFHFSSSMTVAILNDGIVRPMIILAKVKKDIEYNR